LRIVFGSHTIREEKPKGGGVFVRIVFSASLF